MVLAMAVKALIGQVLSSLSTVFFTANLEKFKYEICLVIGNVLYIFSIGFNFFIYLEFNKAYLAAFKNSSFRNIFNKNIV